MTKALGQFLHVKSSTTVSKRSLVGFQHELKSPFKIKHLWPLHSKVVSAWHYFPLPITSINTDQIVWVLHSVSEKMWLSTFRLRKGLTNLLGAPWGLMKWVEKGLFGIKAQIWFVWILMERSAKDSHVFKSTAVQFFTSWSVSNICHTPVGVHSIRATSMYNWALNAKTTHNF